MRECRTRRSSLIVLALTIVLVTRAAAPASAQISEAWLNYTPTEVYAGWGSTRLLGMGDMRVSVVDDRSMIDLYHYSKNPAYIVQARDTSVVEMPWSYQQFNDSYYGQSHTAYQRGGGIHGGIRPGGAWAVGFDVDYGSITSSRHNGCPSPDDCRFIRDFDLPISPNLNEVTTDQTFGAGVSSPYISMTYGRVFKKRLSVGATAGWRQEDENRRFLSSYDLDLTSTAVGFQGGVTYLLPALGNTVTVAGYGRYMNNTVEGVSQSPLNQDLYDWSRPEVSYGAEIQVKKSAWLEGVVDGRHLSFDGEETASVNWAPMFFLNPFPSENRPVNVFKRKWSAFQSGLRHNEVSTRWMVNMPGKPVHVGVGYTYYQEYEWIFPNEEVLPTANELDVKRLGYRFAGGFSLDTPDERGLVAAEVQILREAREDLSFALPNIGMMTYSYHFGAEYKVVEALPVRAGVFLIRHDPNREDGLPPVKGIGLTFGTSYYWRAIGSRIDFSYGSNHFSYSPDDPSQENGTGDRVTLYIQHLF